ncbi:thioesterase family protein [Actinomarinicola tropica]|uniref:thioesterase family protein n=1 Tax=Actinomarinicola tropica TaxID=2789776 RepID=UPI00189B0D1E|nr:thioesterase family protein [Actinomarinicola tropica]
MTANPEALYLPDGDHLVPTELTVGPWDPAAQHGGAPSALLTHAVESADAPVPVQIARLTFELLRPVPLTPLRITTEVLRPGKKVQLVQASLHAGDTEVMRATALRIRRADLPVPDEAVPADPPPPGPEHGEQLQFPGAPEPDGLTFHRDANEILFVDGGFDRPGPATGWIRLRYPVIASETTTPMMRLAGAADFGNGFSWAVPRGQWIFINPDLTIHAVREPLGDWICLRSTTFPGSTGAAAAESALYDGQGRVGRSVQSLLLDRT